MKSNQIFDKLTVELFFYGKIKKNFNIFIYVQSSSISRIK